MSKKTRIAKKTVENFNVLCSTFVEQAQETTETAIAAKKDCTWVRFLKFSRNSKTGEYFDSFKPLWITGIFKDEELLSVGNTLDNINGKGHEQDFETAGDFLAKALHIMAGRHGDKENVLGRRTWIQARRIEGMVASAKMRVPQMEIWSRVSGVTCKITA